MYRECGPLPVISYNSYLEQNTEWVLSRLAGDCWISGVTNPAESPLACTYPRTVSWLVSVRVLGQSGVVVGLRVCYLPLVLNTLRRLIVSSGISSVDSIGD
jgi:hypothetical protein